MSPARDPLQDLTGDRAGAELLRRSLAALAERAPGTDLARGIRDVLAGRRDVRDLAQEPEMATIITEGMRAQERFWAGLSAEEREEALLAGQTYLAELEEEADTGS